MKFGYTTSELTTPSAKRRKKEKEKARKKKTKTMTTTKKKTKKKKALFFHKCFCSPFIYSFVRYLAMIGKTGARLSTKVSSIDLIPE